MKRRISSNMNIGSSTLLLIFVVISLVSFAVMSLSSAVSNMNLVNSSLESNTAYYEASNLAEAWIAAKDTEAMEAYKAGKLVVGSDSVDEVIDENSLLHVSVDIHEPDEAGHLLTVTSYNVITSAPEADNHINVLQ